MIFLDACEDSLYKWFVSPKVKCSKCSFVMLLRFQRLGVVADYVGYREWMLRCPEKLTVIIDFSSLCNFKCLLKSPAWEEAKSHWLHLFDFSPLCVFKCVLKLPAREEAKSHWLHLLNFSPLCVVKCVLNLSAREDAKSHWLHLFDFSLLCIFKCLLKSLAWEEANA